MVMNWELIQKPNGFKIEENKSKEGYIKVSVEPLMRGYGNTVGNTVRRILMSSIEGSAVYGFKLEGFEHPLSTMEGVLHDATQIMLNLKSIRLSILEEDVEVNIKKSGPCVVTAADIAKSNSAVKVINKDQLILEVTGDVDVDLNVYIKRGVGYQLSDQMNTDDKPVGFIPTDALFSPVTKVKYEVVEDIRYKAERNYEKVLMEIWHDTTVDGENFLPYASKIAKDIFAALVNFDEDVDSVGNGNKDEDKDPIEKLLDCDIEELEFSKRPANCLRSANIRKVKQLVTMGRDELMKMKNLGSKSLLELEEKLKQRGLYLGMNIKKKG